jgi:hypothetical protein
MEKVEPQQPSPTQVEEDKNEKPITIIQSVPESELDTAPAGTAGNWRSKTGIAIPGFGNWNPSFKVPSLGRTGSIAWKLAKFYGPGAIISVAYIDPDNYQTAIAAGAEFQYKQLFMLLLSTIIAIYLQVRSILVDLVIHLIVSVRFSVPNLVLLLGLPSLR